MKGPLDNESRRPLVASEQLCVSIPKGQLRDLYIVGCLDDRELMLAPKGSTVLHEMKLSTNLKTTVIADPHSVPNQNHQRPEKI